MAELIDKQALLENLNKFAPEHYNALVNQLIVKMPSTTEAEIRDEAIDSFCEAIKSKYGCCGYVDEISFKELDEIAEQMKGEANE